MFTILVAKEAYRDDSMPLQSRLLRPEKVSYGDCYRNLSFHKNSQSRLLSYQPLADIANDVERYRSGHPLEVYPGLACGPDGASPVDMGRGYLGRLGYQVRKCFQDNIDQRIGLLIIIGIRRFSRSRLVGTLGCRCFTNNLSNSLQFSHRSAAVQEHLSFKCLAIWLLVAAFSYSIYRGPTAA